MRHYKLQHFRPEEFLPPHIFDTYGEHGLDLLMDARILWTMDILREKFDKPITINDYCFGGKLTQRGFRDDSNVGASLSQHRFGRACDFDIKGITSDEFRGMVKAWKLSTELNHITRIENGTSWNHLDCAGIDGNGIIFITP